MKRILAMVLTCAMALGLLAACGNTGDTPTAQDSGTDTGAAPVTAGDADAEATATLTFATWDNEAMLLYDSLDIEARFQELYPNVTIEIEEFKDDEEYFNQMKIRASANELPDLMFLQPRKFPVFGSFMLDLSATEAAGNNILAADYAYDGKIVGIPEKQSGDYVFYWADHFEQAGVSVPKTWEEFVTAMQDLQAYYGADDADYMAIAMGVKDEWPTYPFMEYGPATFSGNGEYWDDMVKVDAPFSEGQGIYDTYTKFYELFSSGVMGSDPLGIGYDQALALFLQQKGGILIDSSLGLAKIYNSVEDTSQLRSFYLPYTTEDGAFNRGIQGDFFLGVTDNSQNPELALAFLEFYFSEAWYPDYIGSLASESTMSTVEKEKDPVMQYADEEQPELNLVMYNAGGDDFNAMVNETQFNYTKLGAEMFMAGFDLAARFEELNDSWKEARETLGL